ncbi:hypothetical protein MJM59_32215, partial [Salmonella enterica subsp. enterica serovar Montevideo]|nr:hypothetical protein [Salmonella enterica subsp. enterica serovar Montevideo]
VEQVARALLNHNHLRIITNSLRVAHILYNNPRFEVMVPGGTLPHASVDTLYVQDDWTNGGRTQHPETLTLVKFKIPPLPANMDA